MTTINYHTSKDYKHLKELLDSDKNVICYVTYDFNHGREKEPWWVTDVCRAHVESKNNPQYIRYCFSVRGCSFGDYWPSMDKFTFEEFCDSLKLEYIEPNKE